MFLNEKERKEYERRFHKYMTTIINNKIISYSQKNKIKEVSLNDLFINGVEFIDLLVGDSDVNYEESFEPEELELIFEDAYVYKAVKSLTNKEKLAIFLRCDRHVV